MRLEIEWTRAGFERLGFVGWKTFGALESRDLPPRHGVYVVVREPGPRPVFLVESVGGLHKRKALTVGVDVLETAWGDNAEVVYVGKAGGKHGLRDRLWDYARQGRGRSAGHAGGRFVWQLPSSEALLVGWRATEDLDVGDVEEALLALHIEQFGRRPFANMKDGYKMAPNDARRFLADAFAQ
ncbi:hypothetical protein [Agromyces albus]|uniref:GIY-YIG nuclease family protein n=1 Tax=Agromyces albus TaxID=205332 RepID=A0A4Q2L877_9MICO|nr:hypothetical protein [Agromyces albus]RXZ72793.1 hypothetical protein ESP51_03055 [Agromyces albus]